MNFKTWDIVATIRSLFVKKTHWARTPEGRRKLAINGAKRWTKATKPAKKDPLRAFMKSKAYKAKVSAWMKAYHQRKRLAADQAFREKAQAQLANLPPLAPLGQNLVDAING